MKKVLKYGGFLLLFILLLVISITSYITMALPDIDAPEGLRVELTPERIERGKYIANHVAVCMDCHSTRDWSRFSGPLAADGKFGGGGERFGREMGFPGNFYARNITPYALKNWTDGELFRAITSGVSKEGKALFPIMPYHSYGKMDVEDVYDIIAYIRTLPEVKNEVPESKADFPVNILINTMPRMPAFTQRPFKNDPLKYGKYLVNMANCVDCHSQKDKGATIPGTEFGGGMEFNMPGGIVRAPNITFERETGLGNWTMAFFVQSFKKYTDTSYHLPVLTAGDLNSPMPWTMYAGMTEEDLKAIYVYLSSLKPIVNEVKRFEKSGS